VADVDGNGSQEIIYGAMTLNANGTGRYTTTFYGHGDALHVGDFIPGRSGLEIWMIHEGSAGPSATLRDANNGAILFSKPNNCNCEGPGRGVAGDVFAGSAGAEFWGAGEGMTSLFNTAGGNAGRNPGSVNTKRLSARRRAGLEVTGDRPVHGRQGAEYSVSAKIRSSPSPSCDAGGTPYLLPSRLAHSLDWMKPAQ
jgi:hypothetical protein